MSLEDKVGFVEMTQMLEERKLLRRAGMYSVNLFSDPAIVTSLRFLLE